MKFELFVPFILPSAVIIFLYGMYFYLYWLSGMEENDGRITLYISWGCWALVAFLSIIGIYQLFTE